jgi:hypothetical protein
LTNPVARENQNGRRTPVFVKVVNSSGRGNSAQLVGDQNGSTIVPVCGFQTFFSSWKKLPSIKKFWGLLSAKET